MRKYGNESFCANLTDNQEIKEKIQEESSGLMLWSNLCLTLPSILLAPFLGSWSDRFGRKFPVLLPAFGAFLSSINYAICSGIQSAPAELLLLSNLFQGLTGGFTGVILAVSSWAASLSSIRRRTSRLGLIEFANLIGTAIAPAIGGVLARYCGYAWAFGFAGGLNVILFTYVLFFLRVEQSSQRVALSSICRGLCRMDPLREIVFFIKTTGQDVNARFNISMAALCLSVTWLVSTGTNETRFLFINNLNLNWDVLKYNLFAAEDAGIRGLTLVTILPVLKHVMLIRDFPIMLAGLFSKVVMFAMWAAAKSSVLIFFAPVVGFLAAAVSACGRSVASKFVQKTDQGKLFAVLAILENLSSLIGSLIFRNVYVASFSWFPGFAFVIADVFLLVPIFFLLCFWSVVRTSESSDALADDGSALIINQDDLEPFPAETIIAHNVSQEEDLRFT